MRVATTTMLRIIQMLKLNFYSDNILFYIFQSLCPRVNIIFALLHLLKGKSQGTPIAVTVFSTFQFITPTSYSLFLFIALQECRLFPGNESSRNIDKNISFRPKNEKYPAIKGPFCEFYVSHDVTQANLRPTYHIKYVISKKFRRNVKQSQPASKLIKIQ